MSGCSSGESPASGTTPNAGNTPSAGPGSSAGAPAKGGTLRIAAAGGGTSDSIDAHDAAGAYPDSMRKVQLYEPLAFPDPKNELEFRLATSFEPKSADSKVWIVKLRDGVEFHNGKTVTAEDVIFSLRRILDEKALPAAAGRGSLKMLDAANLRAVDKTTVEIPLNISNGLFPVDIGQWFNSIVPTDYDPAKPVGTGPFMFQSFTPGKSSTFVKNPNYWGDGPFVDEIIVNSIPDVSARVNALLSGQVDFIQSLPASQLAAVQAVSSLQVLESETGGFLPIVMNSSYGPFKDVRVRQAFRLLADRDQLLKLALSGHGAVGNDLFGRFDPDAAEFPVRKRDVEQAKSLLKQAGYENLKVTLTYVAEAVGQGESAEVFQQQARDGGVEIELNKTDASTYYAKANYNNWPLTVTFWPQTRRYITQALLMTTKSASYNAAHWSPDDYDSLIAQARAESDQAKRAALVKQAQQIDYDTGSHVIGIYTNSIDAHTKKLTGLVPDRYGPIGLANQMRNVSIST